jgi:hypothetical protein
MQNAVKTVSAWLQSQLSNVPQEIRAVYVEWDFSYHEPNTSREVVLIGMDTFGFEDIGKGRFDCSNRDDLYKLGEFTWEGQRGLSLPKLDYPNLDWTEVLKNAAMMPEIQTFARDRNLLLLVGYHDDAVFDVS